MQLYKNSLKFTTVKKSKNLYSLTNDYHLTVNLDQQECRKISSHLEICTKCLKTNHCVQITSQKQLQHVITLR